MGLFGKKICDICGGEIGLLGNKKLEDGNCCKNCASKLSPWFNERRHSTIQSIREQLQYRAENQEKLRDFNPTKTLGKNTKVYIDEDKQIFVVSSARNFVDANPDIINFSDVTGCDVDVDESHYEETKQDANGNTVSYQPRRYKYTYRVREIIRVNNPYFDEMRFDLCSSIDMDVVSGRPFNADNNVEFREAKRLGEDIRQALTSAKDNARREAAAIANQQAVTCPHCGAPTKPDRNGCCEYCGCSVNG